MRSDLLRCPLCGGIQTKLHAEARQRTFYRCSTCELIFVGASDLPSRTEELERYLHHRNDESNEEYRTYLNGLLQPLLERISFTAEGLDYGCGPTKSVELILSESGIKARSFDPLFFPDTEFLNTQYGFIFCAEVVEHFHNPWEEFDKLNRLLKPGGIIEIVTGIYRDDLKFWDWWYIRDRTHVAFYCTKTLKWIADRYGWEEIFNAENVTLFRKTGGK